MADNWDFSLAKVQTATRIAKERAAAHWKNKVWNLWLHWGTPQQAPNPQWVDPVFENEWGYLQNDPNTNPANLVTINAYYCFCWYKYKGYCDTTIAALLYSHTVESKITGATWESLREGLFMHPFHGNAGNWLDGGRTDYSALASFNPTLSARQYNGDWYQGANLAQSRNIYHDSWSEDDGATINNHVLIGQTGDGTYDSVRGAYAADPDYLATGYVIIGGERIVYYHWRNPNNKVYLCEKKNFGYGLVQWTDWWELRTLCDRLSGQFKSRLDTDWQPGYDPLTGTYYAPGIEWWWIDAAHQPPSGLNHTSQGFAIHHWQLNLTLHLMALEFQRACAMAVSPVAHPELTVSPYNQQNGFQWSNGRDGVYYGGWRDTYAAGATWEPRTDSPNYCPYKYTVPCSWDEWASGAFMTKPGIDQRLLNAINKEDTPYRWVRLAMDLFRTAYLNSSPAVPADNAIRYWMNCIEYWNSVWSIEDIPRPREYPWLEFELDYYHINQNNKRFLTIANGRRKKKHERTILL